ncbi:mechanosensitive ion channel family protein [Nitrosococcus watsonii]|uniref:mechanosensitive ion channel family protein n=1 Tax=Nitrosococcus watsonii TaxID=473531 RepID=UPI0003069A90|nr:mechanosensitive ion channel family protein [Nitrosococcus watsonii]
MILVDAVTGEVLATANATGDGLIISLAAWIVFAVFRAIAETIIARPHIDDPGPEASLIRVGASITGFLIVPWVVVKGLQNLGADLIPILAGLGVGGLAVALAAQRTLANMLGSLLLHINKPVKVGDFCRYGDQFGTVEEIGWLSTRIRSLERTLVTVPNTKFSEMKLDNFAVRDERLFKSVLQLRYETTPDQMRCILIQLCELLVGHPMVATSPARVRFTGFSACSKDLEVFAYLQCQDQGAFLAIQEDLLLRMKDIIKENTNTLLFAHAFKTQGALLVFCRGYSPRVLMR